MHYIKIHNLGGVDRRRWAEEGELSGLTDERTRHPQTNLPVTRYPAHRPYRALAQPLLSLSDSYTVR